MKKPPETGGFFIESRSCRHVQLTQKGFIENDMLVSAGAYDTIGSALYDLRQDIQKLYVAHMTELNRVSK